MGNAKTRPDYRPYVALLARQWLNGPDPEALHRVLEGSALFADISGFTKLSERLDRIGREGAEQVTEVISDAFNRLLEPAYSYDGQLVKFGGDALLLFYDGEDHELRAASSALEMRRALRSMGPIETPAGNVTLRMSQGVHSGEFHFFLVGSTFRELIQAGSATTHVASVEGEAGAGQIIVSDTTAAAIPAANLGARKENGRLLRGTLLPLEESTQTVYQVKDDLTPFVPSVLRELIASDAVVSEHRPSTSAFIRFSGVDALLEKDIDAVTELFTELIDDVEAATAPRSIGILNTDVYPDGLKILLAAGAPITTGEDEENMLFALREIVNKDRPLPLHIGVTRGAVFAGDVGTLFRRSYTVMGDQVNLAARLMSRAEPNQVLATDPVLKGSRTLFGTTELEPFMVKGKSKPITAYAVSDPLGARVDTSGQDTPLTGRDDEMEMLAGLWDQTKDGSGSLVLVGGDHGTGKSRLVSEFAATVDDYHTFTAVARRYRSSTPYFTATLLLSEILGIDRYHPDGQGERLNKIMDEVAPELRPFRSLIGTALGIALPESQAELALAPEFRKTRLEESVVALVSAFLTEPTLLWVDDAHWADDASADLLKAMAIATAKQPWLLAVSGRQIERAAEARDVTAPSITLGPLSKEDATAIVHVCTEDAPLAPHVTAAIVERAQGNPMFLLELLGAMDEGDIDAMPDSIEGLVASRIDGLLPEDRRALRQLSVLGTGFRPEFAKVVLTEPASPTVFKRLSEFLDVAPKWVQFSNSLIHQAAYGGLPYRQRRILHGNVAESIERADGSADLLAVHYSAAGRWPETWKYSRIAGDHAKEIYANLEAAKFYDQALEAARYVPDTDPEQRVEVLTGLGLAHFEAGLYDRAGSAFRRARRLSENPVDVARLSRREAEIADKRGDFSGALRWTTKGRQALGGMKTSEADAERAQLSVWQGAMRFAQGRYDEAMRACEQAIDEAERSGDRDALAHAYYLHDLARVFAGEPGENDFSRRALAIYQELENLTGQALVYNNLGASAYFDGRWSEAVELYEKSREARLKSGDPIEAARAEENLGEVLCDRGDLAEAETVLRDALRVWKAVDNPAEVAFVLGQLGRVASRDGRFEDAAALFAEALQAFESIGARYDVVDVRIRAVENLVFQGLGEKALDEIDEAIKDTEGFGEVFVTRLNLMLGYALTQAGRPEEGLPTVEQSLASARERGALYEIALGLEARTRLRQLLGMDDWTEGLEETWSIQETLGIVSIPRVPLYQR